MKNAKERFYEYYQKAKAKNTLKSYRRGLELFLEYYGKDADTVLAERRADISARAKLKFKQLLEKNLNSSLSFDYLTS